LPAILVGKAGTTIEASVSSGGPNVTSLTHDRFASLNLILERKICDLVFCDPPTKRWEASGVLVKDGHYFVVFDNRTEIARVADDLLPNDTNGLLGMVQAKYGFEGITYNGAKQRFYLLVEARKHAKGAYKALIVECDHDFKYVKDRPVNFPFESRNKGFEAIVHLRRNSKDYLLALCEGNKCKRGAKGRKPGGGRVLLFEKKKNAGCMSALSPCRDLFPLSIIQACLLITVA
jgi:hypothetical protein